MKTLSHRTARHARIPSRHDYSALALVAILIGGMFCLSGVLQQVPVVAAIANSVSPSDPVLNAGQTLLVGASLLAAGCGWLVHSTNRGSRR